ncbi:hypothetical protein BJ166DRAFT_163043 [Pestalotiopsis sp. NC0098]|nr:hypothetical protein BJ166DRAFT_163043 [Pestalotiopsis sp. NC0098]
MLGRPIIHLFLVSLLSICFSTPFRFVTKYPPNSFGSLLDSTYLGYLRLASFTKITNPISRDAPRFFLFLVYKSLVCSRRLVCLLGATE